MGKIIFSNELKTINAILSASSLSKAELLSVKYALFVLISIFPDKEAFLLQKSRQVQERINKTNENLTQKILALY